MRHHDGQCIQICPATAKFLTMLVGVFQTSFVRARNLGVIFKPNVTY